MAWLQKRPQVSDPKSFYTLGLNKTVLLVGLGNPGKEYELTRHNIGFSCIDEFVAKMDEMSDWLNKTDLSCLVSTGQISDSRVIAIKPTTFMNKSGQAVQQVSSFYKINPVNIAVVYDDVDIKFGQIRLRLGGASAGHKGIESISQLIGEDYGRIRIGIGPKKPAQIASEDFVLQKFSKAEQSQLTNLKQEATSILSEYVFGNQLPNETRTFLI